jgi:hypothetical protein
MGRDSPTSISHCFSVRPRTRAAINAHYCRVRTAFQFDVLSHPCACIALQSCRRMQEIMPSAKTHIRPGTSAVIANHSCYTVRTAFPSSRLMSYWCAVVGSISYRAKFYAICHDTEISVRPWNLKLQPNQGHCAPWVPSLLVVVFVTARARCADLLVSSNATPCKPSI